MDDKKYISIFPYNGNQYLQNIAFSDKKNKGIEASIFHRLRVFLQQNNICIHTYDVQTDIKPSLTVYFDMPYPWDIRAWKYLISHPKNNVLICNESSLIIPFNYWKILHIFFRRVYTWYDGFVDNNKYFKILLPKSSDGINIRPVKFHNKKFLVMINKNTLPFFPFRLMNSFGRELYSERIKAIEYFERAIPHAFDLFGRGWNKPKKYNISERVFGYKKYKSYKGEIENKIESLSHYKYSICFENLTDVNGYITEKIVDCLKARCVPIYWGASDIGKYIPQNCFIDYRKYGSYEKLLEYLLSVDENAYNAYIRNIEKLLADKKFINLWFEDGFARFFLEDILEIK